ncbi:MAG: YwaF family protein [Verrucomicrobia bacterium]|nr:YwaF family protein [Verrucomicrobiota bacterium]
MLLLIISSLCALPILLKIAAYATPAMRGRLSKTISGLLFCDLLIRIYCQQEVPFHLCAMMEGVAILVLWGRWQWGYEILLFFGASGAFLALLFPIEAKESGHTIAFFVRHFFIAFTPIFLTLHESARPRPNAWWKSVAYLLPTVPAVGLYNAFFDKNYMYLCELNMPYFVKAIVLPWPYYILEGFCILLALSFTIAKIVKRLDAKKERRPTILIMTSKGGGGHLTAAKAKIAEMKEKYPEMAVIEKQPFAALLKIDIWAFAQKTGNTKALTFIDNAGRKYFAFFIEVGFFFYALLALRKHKTTLIIDTLSFGAKATIKAIRYRKWRYKEVVLYEKILTELPTEKTENFFFYLARLSSKDRPYFRLMTTYPLLKEGETDAAFWLKHTGLSMENIVYGSLPVRKAFQEYADKKRVESKKIVLEILYKDSKSQGITEEAASFGNFVYEKREKSLLITLHPKDKVAMLMMGANPQTEAMLSYVDHFIQFSQKHTQKNRKDLLFIFCSTDKGLQEKILSHIKNTKDYPASLTIFVLPYQDDRVLAPLLHRADLTISRSGGLTSMELFLVATGSIFIHKEDKKFTMPIWEYGNFTYLAAKKGAKLISMASFPEIAGDYFTKGAADRR